MIEPRHADGVLEDMGASCQRRHDGHRAKAQSPEGESGLRTSTRGGWIHHPPSFSAPTVPRPSIRQPLRLQPTPILNRMSRRRMPGRRLAASHAADLSWDASIPIAILVVGPRAVGAPGNMVVPRGRGHGRSMKGVCHATIARRCMDAWAIARRQRRHNRRCGQEFCFLHCRNRHGQAIAGE